MQEFIRPLTKRGVSSTTSCTWLHSEHRLPMRPPGLVLLLQAATKAFKQVSLEFCGKTILARKGAYAPENQSEEMSNFLASRCGVGGTSENMGANKQLLKDCPICKKCYIPYTLSTARESSLEGVATVDDPEVLAPTPEQDSLLETVQGSSKVWLDDAIAWLCYITTLHGFLITCVCRSFG